MDYNRIYKARYLFIVEGFMNVKVIAEQTGLSLEMVYKAISDDMKHYPMVKEDFAEDLAKGDFSRKYPEPKRITLRDANLTRATDRYIKLLYNGEATLDQIKSYLIADNVRDSQIDELLPKLNQRFQEMRLLDYTETAQRLLAIEQLPPKWSINKTRQVVQVYPSPMVDKNSHIYGIKYTAEKVNWRKNLPTELAIKLYELEHPLYIDGHKLSQDPETWGPREYEIIIGTKRRKHGYYLELADLLGLEEDELQPYINKARGYVANAKKVTEVEGKAEAEPVDSQRIALIIADLKAKYRARGGNIQARRSRKKTVNE